MSAASRIPVLGWLFPSFDEPGSAIVRRVGLTLTVSLTIANLLGAGIVFAFGTFVLPLPEGHKFPMA